MTRVLLTGATGFVGRHTLHPLLRRGYEIHAVSQSRVDTVTSGVRWHQANLLNTGEVIRLLSEVRPTHLVHLAWFATPGAFWSSPLNLEWVRATLTLLKSFADNGGQRAVLAGTCAEYDWSDGRCMEDVTPCRPVTLYGACKNGLRGIAEAFARQSTFELAWARLFFMYGPGEHPDRLVASVVRALLRGAEVPCSAGRQRRDFLHVSDVGEALAVILESSINGAVNVASGEAVPVAEVIEYIAAALHAEALVGWGRLLIQNAEPPVLVGDVQRLRGTGWSPQFGLHDGLDDAIAWWKSNG